MSQVYRFIRPMVIPVLLWSVIGAGMALRIHNADRFPIYQNDDGLFYVWAGNSILDNFKHPTSLTIFESGNPQLIWRSQYRNIYPVDQFGYRIADPWFDHPFLSTLLIAAPARLLGYHDFSQIPHMVVRAPALFAGLFTLILTYLLASCVFSSKRVGLTAVAVLAFWPLAVLSSRQSYIENMMTPVWLLSLWLTWKSTKLNNRVITGAIIACNFFLGWSKIIGYLSFAVSGFWLVKNRQLKQAAIIAAAGLITFGLYAAYGTLIGGDFFWQSLLNQGGRGTYVTSFFKVLVSPDVFGVIEDGWWFIGWFALIWMFGGKTKEKTFIALNAIFWMFALFILSGPQNTSPWYRYPVYPLLAIASGRLLVDWWKTYNPITAGLVLMLGLTGYKLAGVDIGSTLLRLGSVLFIGAFFLNNAIVPKRWQPWVVRPLIAVWAAVVIIGNVAAVRTYPQSACQNGACVQPAKIDVTRLP